MAISLLLLCSIAFINSIGAFVPILNQQALSSQAVILIRSSKFALSTDAGVLNSYLGSIKLNQDSLSYSEEAAVANSIWGDSRQSTAETEQVGVFRFNIQPSTSQLPIVDEREEVEIIRAEYNMFRNELYLMVDNGEIVEVISNPTDVELQHALRLNWQDSSDVDYFEQFASSLYAQEMCLSFCEKERKRTRWYNRLWRIITMNIFLNDGLINCGLDYFIRRFHFQFADYSRQTQLLPQEL